MKRILSLLCLAVLNAAAEDFVLSDGSVLKDAAVVRTAIDSVLVRHSSGVQRLLFDRLSPELQARFGMTPELVSARRAELQAAADTAAREREAEQAARLAALQSSGNSPRYLTGAEVISLFAAVDTLSAREADYLAAEWNRREASRLNLPSDIRRWGADAAALKPAFDAERAAFLAEYCDKAQLRSTVSAQDATISRQKDEISALKKEIAILKEAEANLRRQNDRLRADSGSNTTVVVDRPVYVPTPVPAVCPHPHRPSPPTMRPSRPPRPVIHSNNPRPASSAHTLPRR